MAYPQLRTGGAKSYSSQLFDSSNLPIDFPEGTTFSAMTSDFNIATASVTDGVVSVTPRGDVTGNVFVTLTASIPGNTAGITGTLLIHIMDAPLTEKEYIQLTPEV